MRIPSVVAAAVLAFACAESPPATELGRAVAAGDLPRLSALLQDGADPDLEAGGGLVPLHVAARDGRLEAIRLLVAAGARVDRPDRTRHGWPPLLHAIHRRHVGAARALLEAGADPNGRAAGGGVTPLIMASGYGMTATVRALLEAGADPYAEAGLGRNALWGALGGGALADITDGPPLGSCFPETVRALIARAPDLRLRQGWAARATRLLARSDACREAYALAEARAESRARHREGA